MDSKLRRMAILVSMGAILLISVLVLYANRESFSAGGQETLQDGQTVQSIQTVQSSQTVQSIQGGQDAPQAQSAPGGQIGDDLSAFLEDETFFDREINPVLEAARNQENRLSLMVTSVEKDLRIQIVDMSGELVSGESFYVRLDDSEEYKDLDQDGVIYIGGLSAGEYYVELLPIEGYKVPTNETRVRVKDKVEYLAIEDISLLIKTEDEIDAQAEDSGVQDAIEDADSTEIRKLQTATGK